MREFKFRAWDKGEDESVSRMLYSDKQSPWDVWFNIEMSGKAECAINYNYCDSFGDEHDNWKPLDNIMQFTGLHDKNGVEIYEGDIIYGTIKGLLGQGYQNGIVKWGEYSFIIDLQKQQWEPGIGIVGFCSFEDFEVVGNIHQERLEKK